jgi:hypothetical protein
MPMRDDDEAADGAEPLFTRTTAGVTWTFVAGPDRCAVLLDGEPVASGDATPASVARVLDAFLRAAPGVRADAGPRVPPASDTGRGGWAGPP